jgi:S1-C subfamily serine protease
VSVRRSFLYSGLTLFLTTIAFGAGSWSAHRAFAQQIAGSDARTAALQNEMALAIGQAHVERTGTSGPAATDAVAAAGVQPALVEEIKRQIQSEMGLLPVRLLRERKNSFVELNSYDASGKSSYGTAGYLGNGYFVTVKHAVVALDDAEGHESQRITSVKVRINGRDVAAKLVDAGDATVEVESGDWAIIRVAEPVDLPALRVNTHFGFEFADPIFRLGNDYSKGIILGTGYVGQRMSNGLVTCLTDGHPGVSGGGVLDQEGDLVGIPTGRMQGDYRFSFILPVREEMFRKVPSLTSRAGDIARAQ